MLIEYSTRIYLVTVRRRGTYKNVVPSKAVWVRIGRGPACISILQDEHEMGQGSRKLWGEQAIQHVRSLAQLELERQVRNEVVARRINRKVSRVGEDVAQHDEADCRTA